MRKQLNEEFKRMQKLAGLITENNDNSYTPTHRSKVDWYYVNEDSDYPGPKGRVVPIAAGYKDPRNFNGTELYIPAESMGWVNGTKFEDEEGNDVPFLEKYFEKINTINETQILESKYFFYDEEEGNDLFWDQMEIKNYLSSLFKKKEDINKFISDVNGLESLDVYKFENISDKKIEDAILQKFNLYNR